MLEARREKEHADFVNATHLLGFQEIDHNGRISLVGTRPEDRKANDILYENYMLRYKQLSNMIEELDKLCESSKVVVTPGFMRTA